MIRDSLEEEEDEEKEEETGIGSLEGRILSSIWRSTVVLLRLLRLPVRLLLLLLLLPETLLILLLLLGLLPLLRVVEPPLPPPLVVEAVAGRLDGFVLVLAGGDENSVASCVRGLFLRSPQAVHVAADVVFLSVQIGQAQRSFKVGSTLRPCNATVCSRFISSCLMDKQDRDLLRIGIASLA